MYHIVVTFCFLCLNTESVVSSNSARSYGTFNEIGPRSYNEFKYGIMEGRYHKYVIDPAFDEDQVDEIERSLDLLRFNTCLKFDRSDDNVTDSSRQWIYFSRNRNSEGTCYTRIQDRKPAIIYIKDYCITEKWVLHEIFHYMGFHHEHQRKDRNCFIRVHKSMLNDTNFKIRPEMDTSWPYDKYSVTHYRDDRLFRDVPWKEEERPKRKFLLAALGFLFYEMFRPKDHKPESFGSTDGTSWDFQKVNYLFCYENHFCRDSYENIVICDKISTTLDEKNCRTLDDYFE